ncbi:DUF6297 family protein [Gordonia humi]|uniref:DUF6297 family protein n=1 Tax=Gordonia humi TaxID=686429 RepID=UPI003621EB50
MRVDRETVRWTMSGPASRTRPLAGRLGVAAGCVLAATMLLHGALALLVSDTAVTVLVAGVGSAAVAIAVAYAAQLVRDRGRGNGRAGISPGRLHRMSFAPRDGFAGAVGLAVSMMDASWIADARITRWQRRSSACRRRVRTTAATAFIGMDARRLTRHPEMIMRWACWTAVAVVCPLLLHFHRVPMLIPALAVWLAGTAASGGLAAATDPTLRRAFGVDDRQITLWHCVIPAGATVASALIAVVAAGPGPLGGAVMLLGCTVAVLRRATRPPLPFDAPVAIDSVMTGAAFQPALFAAQLRGLVAAVVTGLLAGGVL